MFCLAKCRPDTVCLSGQCQSLYGTLPWAVNPNCTGLLTSVLGFGVTFALRTLPADKNNSSLSSGVAKPQD